MISFFMILIDSIDATRVFYRRASRKLKYGSGDMIEDLLCFSPSWNFRYVCYLDARAPNELR